jgi:filamentation induced by cAMP protein fic
MAELELERGSWTPGDQAVLNRCTYFYSELNAIHPFRESNGQTIRLLLSLLTNCYHWELQWKRATAEQNQLACAAAFYGDETALWTVMRRVGRRIAT